MTKQTNRTHVLPSRKSLRARCVSTARFQCGRELGGHAQITDVGHGGLSLTADVGLKVGTHLLIELDDLGGEGFAELKGKVVWVRDSEGGSRMGVRVFADDNTAHVVLSDWLHAALKEQSGALGLSGRQRVLVDLAIASKETDHAPSVWQLLRPAQRFSGVNGATATF